MFAKDINLLRMTDIDTCLEKTCYTVLANLTISKKSITFSFFWSTVDFDLKLYRSQSVLTLYAI